MNKHVRLFLKISAVLVFFGVCFYGGRRGITVFTTERITQPGIILDAGHGGEDGGALSESGIKESDLNLEITLKLDQLLGLMGKPSILTRDSDISLHDVSAVTLREKKRSDLKKRVEIAGKYPDALWVSIHQNSYQDSVYWGTQVFCVPGDFSIALAKEMQCAVKKYIQPENVRQVKPVPDHVYLMNQIKNRAVLVECGFLSNPEEEVLLQQDNYQKTLALVFSATLVSV